MRLRHLITNVWNNYSLLRAYENDLVQGLSLGGRGIDLGAKSKDAKYYSFMNLGRVEQMEFVDYFHAGEDIIKMDLETKFPIADEQYDFVLFFNVMEHIYNYQNLISESTRILKKGAMLHGMVPFIHHYHPDPHDYFRFTGECLKKILEEHELENIAIKPIAYGPFKVVASQLGQVFRVRIIRLIIYLVCMAMDRLFALFSTGSEKYAMAYYFSATKN